MRILITLLVTVFLMISNVNPQKSKLPFIPFKEIKQVALEALMTFTKLINAQNYKSMGFESLNEVRVATLGEPLQVLMVRLDKLQKYEPQSDPNRILDTVYQVIYPVKVEKNVRSSIVVGKMKQQWEATAFGGPNLIKMLTKVRKDNSDSTKLPISSYFVVQVPALNLNFIAHRINDELMLTPILDDPSYGFRIGITMSADKVFTSILPAAKEHDGLPR